MTGLKNVDSALTIAVAIALYAIINSKITVRAVIIVGLLVALAWKPSNKAIIASSFLGGVLYVIDMLLMRYVPQYRRIAAPLYASVV